MARNRIFDLGAADWVAVSGTRKAVLLVPERTAKGSGKPPANSHQRTCASNLAQARSREQSCRGALLHGRTCTSSLAQAQTRTSVFGVMKFCEL